MPGATEPPNSGAGIYFDGVTSTRRDVVVELGPASLQISGHDGNSLAQWPYDEIEELTAPETILRLGRRRSPTLERLEIRDAAFAAERHRSFYKPQYQFGKLVRQHGADRAA